jgi:hypothetical protein
MRYVWACAAVAGFLLVCLLVSRPTVVSGQDKPKARPVWEYKVLNGIQVGDPEEGLNKLGAEGWELVALLPGIPHPDCVAKNEKDQKTTITLAVPHFYYLKRPAK